MQFVTRSVCEQLRTIGMLDFVSMLTSKEQLASACASCAADKPPAGLVACNTKNTRRKLAVTHKTGLKERLIHTEKESSQVSAFSATCNRDKAAKAKVMKAGSRETTGSNISSARENLLYKSREAPTGSTNLVCKGNKVYARDSVTAVLRHSENCEGKQINGKLSGIPPKKAGSSYDVSPNIQPVMAAILGETASTKPVSECNAVHIKGVRDCVSLSAPTTIASPSTSVNDLVENPTSLLTVDDGSEILHTQNTLSVSASIPVIASDIATDNASISLEKRSKETTELVEPDENADSKLFDNMEASDNGGIASSQLAHQNEKVEIGRTYCTIDSLHKTNSKDGIADKTCVGSAYSVTQRVKGTQKCTFKPNVHVSSDKTYKATGSNQLMNYLFKDPSSASLGVATNSTNGSVIGTSPPKSVVSTEAFSNSDSSSKGCQSRSRMFGTQPGSAIVATQMVKTKWCLDFKSKGCSRGEGCPYAHSNEELRDLPDLTKTKICPLVLSGKACDNANCRFAHCDNELRMTCAFSEFRTRLCKFAKQQGGRGCLYGNRCPYAHNEQQLRKLTQPTRPQTEIFLLSKSKQKLLAQHLASSKANTTQNMLHADPQSTTQQSQNAHEKCRAPARDTKKLLKRSEISAANKLEHGLCNRSELEVQRLISRFQQELSLDCQGKNMLTKVLDKEFALTEQKQGAGREEHVIMKEDGKQTQMLAVESGASHGERKNWKSSVVDQKSMYTPTAHTAVEGTFAYGMETLQTLQTLQALQLPASTRPDKKGFDITQMDREGQSSMAKPVDLLPFNIERPDDKEQLSTLLLLLLLQQEQSDCMQANRKDELPEQPTGISQEHLRREAGNMHAHEREALLMALHSERQLENSSNIQNLNTISNNHKPEIFDTASQEDAGEKVLRSLSCNGIEPKEMGLETHPKVDYMTHGGVYPHASISYSQQFTPHNGCASSISGKENLHDLELSEQQQNLLLQQQYTSMYVDAWLCDLLRAAQDARLESDANPKKADSPYAPPSKSGTWGSKGENSQALASLLSLLQRQPVTRAT